MNLSRAYRPGRRADLSAQTRSSILGAVRELLAEGQFHQATVEEVARRAGVARATLYQHFRSRVGLIDALCETFDANPALLALRLSVENEDADVAIDESIANIARFWNAEETILQQLYGVTAVDEAAADLVRRQTEDRRGELTRLLAHLRESGRLRKEISDKDAIAHLLVLTSFETYEELRRRASIPERRLVEFLQRTARAILFV